MTAAWLKGVANGKAQIKGRRFSLNMDLLPPLETWGQLRGRQIRRALSNKSNRLQ